MSAPELVGRDRELESLSIGLSALGAGRGATFFIVGEPGIGKSCLAAALADRATARGFRVVWGRCWEGAGAPPFWPWIQILRSLARQGEAVDDLSQLLPESGRRSDPASSDRFEVLDRLGRLLGSATGRKPLVVVLEDLHAADHASLSAVEFVVRHTRELPLLVLGTYRDVGARSVPEANALLERAARAATILHLPRLSADEVTALLGNDAATAGEVYRLTEGNPLFVHEVRRVLPTLRAPSGRISIPGGVRAAIREHLRLAGGPDEALEVAATLGREFGLAAISAILERSQISTAESLGPAMRAGLLTEPLPRQYRFTHVLIRDTLYDDLAPGRRAELHLRAGEALARLHQEDPAAPLEEIAHHFFEAGPASIDAAIEAARRAAERAIRMLAFEQAAAGLERALAALESELPGDLRRRAELFVEIGRARILCGDAEGGLGACRRAAALARSLASAELLARAALTFGHLYTFGVPGGELAVLLEESIAALGAKETPLLARAMARLAGALQPAATPDRPIALARESIAMARRLRDEDTLLYVLRSAGSALFNVVDPAESIPLQNELVRLAARHGDLATVLHARCRLFTALLDAGDVAAADAELAAYERAAVGLKQPRYHWPAALMRATRAQIEGRFSACESELAEARRLADAAGEGNELLSIAANAMVARRQRGDQGVTAPPDLMPAFAPIPGAAALFAIPRVAGQEARLQAALLAAPETCLSGWAATWTAFGVWIAEMALFAGEPAMITKVYDWLLPAAGRNGAWGGLGMCLEGPVPRWLCALAARLERWADAERHYQDGLSRALRLGMRPFVAQLKFEWAGALARRGRRDEAERLLEEARAIAGELDMRELLSRLAPAPIAVSELRMTQEDDVWLVEGEGERCRVKASRGLQMLATLLANPGREFHCLELGGNPGDPHEKVDVGDAGPALDRQAFDAYRRRLGELRAEIDDAQSCNDVGRAARARAETELLEQELGRCFGLGGRDRKQASAVERARVNVQRRIRLAVAHVEERSAALGRRLTETIRTGTFCCFEPDAPRRHRSG